MELEGVEPSTSSMPRKRSPTELQPRVLTLRSISSMIGAPEHGSGHAMNASVTAFYTISAGAVNRDYPHAILSCASGFPGTSFRVKIR